MNQWNCANNVVDMKLYRTIPCSLFPWCTLNAASEAHMGHTSHCEESLTGSLHVTFIGSPKEHCTITLSSLCFSLDCICLFPFFLRVPVATGDSIVKIAHLLWLSAIFLGNLVVENLPKVTEVISTCSLTCSEREEQKAIEEGQNSIKLSCIDQLLHSLLHSTP